MDWSVSAGTYYLNLVGTSGNVWVDNTLDGSNYSVSGVITVDRNAYEDWSAPYGDAYQASSNYGNFLDLKVSVGSSCDRVPVQVIIDNSIPSCIISSHAETNGVQIDVYPNPSTSDFNLTLDQSSRVVVYNIEGQQVAAFLANSGVTTFGAGLESGVYFLRVDNTSGSKTTKLIKQ